MGGFAARLRARRLNLSRDPPAGRLREARIEIELPDASIKRSTLVYDGWTRLERIAFEMPDGAVVERHIEEHGDGVAVLPYDPARRTALLVAMPRPPVVRAGEADLLEAIAGGLDGEEAESCARREAMEEAGVRLGRLEFVANVWTMPFLSTERIALYLAPYSAADRIAPGGGAAGEHENIRVHELPLAALRDMAEAGTLADHKTLTLVQSLRLRAPHLFER
jgi:nudix-type nucleoside diphosphatase (YffH/AdpP family)